MQYFFAQNYFQCFLVHSLQLCFVWGILGKSLECRACTHLSSSLRITCRGYCRAGMRKEHDTTFNQYVWALVYQGHKKSESLALWGWFFILGFWIRGMLCHCDYPFMCQLDSVTGFSDTWLNLILCWKKLVFYRRLIFELVDWVTQVAHSNMGFPPSWRMKARM